MPGCRGTDKKKQCTFYNKKYNACEHPKKSEKIPESSFDYCKDYKEFIKDDEYKVMISEGERGLVGLIWDDIEIMTKEDENEEQIYNEFRKLPNKQEKLYVWYVSVLRKSPKEAVDIIYPEVKSKTRKKNQLKNSPRIIKALKNFSDNSVDNMITIKLKNLMSDAVDGTTEAYTDLMKLYDSEKDEKLKNPEFKPTIRPEAIIANGKLIADMYSKAQDKKSESGGGAILTFGGKHITELFASRTITEEKIKIVKD